MQCWPSPTLKEDENVTRLWAWELILWVYRIRLFILEMSDFIFFSFSSQQNLSTSPSPALCHPHPLPSPSFLLKRNSNRLLESVFWMTEGYLPGASSELLANVSESGVLLAVGQSGNKKIEFLLWMADLFAIHCQSSSGPLWPPPSPHKQCLLLTFLLLHWKKMPNCGTICTMEQISKAPNSET